MAALSVTDSSHASDAGLKPNTGTPYCTYVGKVNKSLQKSLLNPVLTAFSEALVAALSIPCSSHASDAGLKTQVLYLCRRSE